MKETDAESRRREEARRRNNLEFVRRLRQRRPKFDLKAAVAAAEMARAAQLAKARTEGRLVTEAAGAPFVAGRDMVAESIVFKERPVLFVQDDWINSVDVTTIGDEAKELVASLEARRATLKPLLPLVGRIDVAHFPNLDFLGTAWFIAPDIIVTNKHVASLVARWDGRKFVFNRGIAGNTMSATLDTMHEYDDDVLDQARRFAVTEVLYIEPESGPHDIAFLRVARHADGAKPTHITIAPADAGENTPVLVVGYPARAPKRIIPDQDLMKDLYRDRFDVKRAAPGFTMSDQRGAGRHDCTTLGGNSGSVVFDVISGAAVGLHFAGLYQESNYAVRASVLNEYISRKRWTKPPSIETNSSAGAHFPASASAAVVAVGGTITVPLTITVSIGDPDAHGHDVRPANPTLSAAAADEAAKSFWDQRPDGVIAVRIGFIDDGDRIGETPLIAASVPVADLESFQSAGPRRFQGLEVRYVPANAAEVIDSLPALESVDSIEYDDDARRSKDFSFAEVSETMTVTAHVGPEYSWDQLEKFLAGANQSLVSAIYEFHGPHIADALEDRLKAGVSLKLVMDNSTFINIQDPSQTFDRLERFQDWANRFTFERIVAPEGTGGLISDAYHIKVTVREDDTFWLSSGNWKIGSSQPPISDEQRENGTFEDLPGNREWHVIVKSKTLAARFKSHILQDMKRAAELGAGPVPKRFETAGVLIDIPIHETLELERRAPRQILEPKVFNGKRTAKPILTPDKEGEIYCEAVLALIRSARESLLFQIPYIGMPSNPREDRGSIDELIKALTQKLKTLPDARVLLRAQGSRYSDPTHAAWYFKSKGVDIANRLRRIDDHHTKGMIVDGQRVLIGSHNWSKPGVTLNRDASLIFDDAEVASYFADAFEIDWDRARPIAPKRFVTTEGVVVESSTRDGAPPPGYRRVSLADLLNEDD